MEIRVDPQRLRRILEVIVGERSPLAAGAIWRQSKALSKRIRQLRSQRRKRLFFAPGKTFRNIVGRQSAQRGASMIILGAHFDSVQGTPGADDNASGVAVLWKRPGYLLALE